MAKSTTIRNNKGGRPPSATKIKPLLIYPSDEERAAFERYATAERRPLANAIVYLATKALQGSPGGPHQ